MSKKKKKPQEKRTDKPKPKGVRAILINAKDHAEADNWKQRIYDAEALRIDDRQGLSPREKQIEKMVLAAGLGEIILVKRFIEQGVPIDALDTKGESALICAAKNKRNDLVKLLIQLGADVNLQSEDGTTALIEAYGRKDKECAHMLINAGANVEIAVEYFKEQRERLQKAIVESRARREKMRKENPQPTGQARVDAVEQFLAQKRLFEGCAEGDEDKVKEQIAKGADVDKRDEFQDTPLGIVCRNGHILIVGILIEAGAEVDTVVPLDKSDDPKEKVFLMLFNEPATLVHLAKRSGYPQIAQLLISAGAQVDEGIEMPSTKN